MGVETDTSSLRKQRQSLGEIEHWTSEEIMQGIVTGRVTDARAIPVFLAKNKPYALEGIETEAEREATGRSIDLLSQPESAGDFRELARFCSTVALELLTTPPEPDEATGPANVLRMAVSFAEQASALERASAPPVPTSEPAPAVPRLVIPENGSEVPRLVLGRSRLRQAEPTPTVPRLVIGENSRKVPRLTLSSPLKPRSF